MLCIPASLQQEILHFLFCCWVAVFQIWLLSSDSFSFGLLAILKEIWYLHWHQGWQCNILGINRQNSGLLLDTKFVFLFHMVVEIQYFKYTPSSFALQDFSFQAQLVPVLVWHRSKLFLWNLVLYKVKWSFDFYKRILKTHCTVWFQLEAIFQGIQGGANGLPGPLCWFCISLHPRHLLLNNLWEFSDPSYSFLLLFHF